MLNIGHSLALSILACSILWLAVPISDANAARQCPAQHLDESTEDPQQVLLDYLHQSDQLATELGLSPSFAGMTLAELIGSAQRPEEGREFPLQSLRTSADGGEDPTPEQVAAAATKIVAVIGGERSHFSVTANELVSLQELALSHAGESPWNELTARTDSSGTFFIGRETALLVQEIAPSLASYRLEPERVSLNLPIKTWRVVPSSDFEDPIDDPLRRRGSLSSGGVSSGEIQPGSTDAIEQCNSPAEEMAAYVLTNGATPESILSLFRGPPWDEPVRVDNDTVRYVNLVNSFDACCLRTMDDLQANHRQQIAENTGTVLQVIEDGPSLARGSATLIGRGILVTARHVIEGVDTRDIRFSFFAEPTRERAVIGVVTGDHPYSESDDPSDYAFLVLDGPTPPGLAVGSEPDVGQSLLIAAFNHLTYETQTLFQRLAGLEPSVPAWHRSVRWDAQGHCEVKQLIEVDGDADACFQHGCQTEAGSSGAGLFAPDSQGKLNLVGIHVKGENGQGCKPRLRNRGNIGITLKPEEVARAISEGAKLRGGTNQ